MTKRPYQLRQETTNTGPSIYRLGTFTTTPGERTKMESCFLVFTRFQNVSSKSLRLEPSVLILYPLAEKQDADCAKFRKFRRQLFHTTLAKILQPLKIYMSKPDVVRCADGHYRRAIYGIGPYIADYPEQCLIAAVVQRWCPK